MVGRTLSAVTLAETGIALTENYLKVELAAGRAPNARIDVRIGGVSKAGLREVGQALPPANTLLLQPLPQSQSQKL
jgi:hypothetical protein